MKSSLSETSTGIPVTALRAAAYHFVLDNPESDGTKQWDATVMVVVEIQAGDVTGVGYTYADSAAAELIIRAIHPAIVGQDVMNTNHLWECMRTAVRNEGIGGIAMRAISAVDAALWDAKAKLLEVSVAALLGSSGEAVPLYGSGGFTSYSKKDLKEDVLKWVMKGMSRIKIKVGRQPEKDLERAQAAVQSIGGRASLFVDANGAYSAAQAADFAQQFRALGVEWFEEPLSSDNLEGLAALRRQRPGGIAIAAGEYGDNPYYFRGMQEAGAVDILQIDMTRAGGVTGFLKAAAVAEAFFTPVSSHTAPAIHLPVCAALPGVVHMEYFEDHVRIEQRYLEGISLPAQGKLVCEKTRPGFGFEFKKRDAADFCILGEL